MRGRPRAPFYCRSSSPRHDGSGDGLLVPASSRGDGRRPGARAAARPVRCERTRIERDPRMTVSMRQLLESGVHFGHQTRRWNPKMKRFIFTERNGIYIIDLRQTLDYIEKAYDYIRNTVAEGGSVLFVGTKKQAQEAIAEQAARVGMPYVNHRWLGGMLTNFQTVYKRLQRMKELESLDLTGAAAGLHQEGDPAAVAREDQADPHARRSARHAEAAGRDLGGRHQEGAHRRRRGPQAGHPGDRGARHQLRPGRGRLPDPGQRRRHPLRRAADPRGRRRRRPTA